MASKKFLSEKKVPFTISISKALAEWIDRYVRVQAEKNPADEQYKNRSAFLNKLLNKVMRLLSEGLSIDTIGQLPDKEIVNFYSKNTFNALIPVVEHAFSISKFNKMDVREQPKLFLGFRNLIMKDMEPRNYKTLDHFVERIKRYLVSNNTSRDIWSETFTHKEYYFNGHLDYEGIYPNLHFENCKIIAGILGILGLKMTNFIFSKKEIYARFEFIATELYFEDKIVLEKRKQLIDKNLDYLINYNNLLEDDAHHLWLKFVEEKNSIITFQDKSEFDKWFDKVKYDVEKFGDRKNLTEKILQIFDKLHWIDIIDLKTKEFDIRISEEKFPEEIEIMKEILAKYGDIEKTNGHFVVSKMN
ncbi:MAG: hypothetical protein BAJALOKI2v1_110059 [Promethearchaeota archaeon]|nr:MAG: hypothetical protein BAJALOKI2v1_110059 [Candidatus Lokiarchaeota archaeon]